MWSPVHRPVIFLDVDGPLIPFGASQEQMPNGYPVFGRGLDNPLLERVDPILGKAFRELPGELVWATTWEDEANEVLSPILGLPRLSFVTWPAVEDASRTPRGVHWKTEAVLAWSAGRALVWIDDEISDMDREWVSATHPAPSYLLRVDHRVGLTRADLADVHAWLRDLAD